MILREEKIAVNEKIIPPSVFQQLRVEYRTQGLKVAHCHGVFDLLHPGHIAYLEEAKSLADILVVSITAASYVNKGPGRPFFSDELRMQSLAALSCVDYVILVDAPTAIEIIEIIQPEYYVKGQEYAVVSDDITGNIVHEVNQVRKYGGDVYFTTGVVFSSTKLINNNFPVFPPGVKEFVQTFANQYSFNNIRNIVDSLENIKVLVIGDIVIDEYVFCGVQGLMSKDRALSTRYSHEERYMGGALAIAKHLSGFSNRVTVCSIVEENPLIHSRLLNEMSSAILLDLHVDPKFKTAVKRRYLERRGIRNEYEKLFSVNYLFDDSEAQEYDRKPFCNRLEQIISQYDLVIVADYGHGLINQQVMEIVQEKSKFLALNCQTNSSNFGTNLITKYRRADAFTLDDRELRLAYADRLTSSQTLLEQLANQLQSRQAWVTVGSLGSVGVDWEGNRDRFPALTLTVQDVVGAGDAFFALAAMSACVEAPLAVGSFLGNIAGALAVNILGNSRSITKTELLKFASTMLNF